MKGAAAAAVIVGMSMAGDNTLPLPKKRWCRTCKGKTHVRNDVFGLRLRPELPHHKRVKCPSCPGSK